MDFNATFNCNGKVNFNDWQLSKTSPFLHGEIDNVLFPARDYPFTGTDVKLFDFILPGATAILNLKHLTRCAEMQLKLISRHENCRPSLDSTNSDGRDFFSLRTMVCEFLLYIRIYMNSIKWDLYSLRIVNPHIEEHFDALFVSIKRFLGKLRLIPDSIFHYAVSNLGNKCKQPEFHVYHMHIEIRWLFITLVHNRSIYWQYSEEDLVDNIENVLGLVINDLVYISLKVFERLPLSNMRQKLPYNCTCIRELWLMLQVFSDDLAERMKSKYFWDQVNLCIGTVLNRTRSEDSKVCWHKSMQYNLPDCKNPELFCIWLIYHLCLLYGYNNDGEYMEYKSSRIRSNYEQVERILKAYVSKGGKDGERDEIDEELRVMIPLLRDLVTDWWQPKISIISLLWDCFHKRLDQPFLLQTTGPWTYSVEKKSPMDIFKQVKDRIEGNFEPLKESSFGMFLRFLGSFLKKNYSSNETKYWNQIKGRVYSKFSKSKVQEFSESGLYNFISLFLTLAVTADTANVCSVMLDLLPQIQNTAENSRKSNLIWKGKLVVLLLYNELGINFQSIASSYIDVVNVTSCRKDDTSRSMIASFVDVLSIILSTSKQFERSEHVFIGGWIDRYLLECPKNRIGTLIRVLINVFEKCVLLKTTTNALDGVKKVLDGLWCYVACRVRQFVFNPAVIGDNYDDISKLAVEFTLDALADPATAKKHKHSAVSLFQHFAASVIVKDIRITRYYLMLIVQNAAAVQNLKKEIKNFNVTLVQAWIKCSVLGYDAGRNEIVALQNFVSELDDIKHIFATAHDLSEHQHESQSILTFIMSSMKIRNALKTEQERTEFDIRWRLYFNNIDKWVLFPITEESKDSELAFWVYRCIGTLILCTSPMLYVKNQPNNMFRLLINKIALPSDQSPHAFVKHLGKRIFSMIILGLENLNVKSDISLQALLRDLFDQYMPLLITESNSSSNFVVSDALIKCFKDAKIDFLRLMFEMLTGSFLKISQDNVMHKHSYLVILLLKNLLKAGKTYVSHVAEFIVSICCGQIITCYMRVHDHHPHKQQTVDFIGDIICSPYYKENHEMKNKLKTAIISVLERYLTVMPQSAFDFLRSIARVEVDIVESLYSKIENILLIAERNRRPNIASLRYSWCQLQSHVRNVQKKL